MDFDAERQELNKKRSELVLSKLEHESKLTALKNVVRSSGKMEHHKYKQCCDAQNTHSRALLHINKALAPIKIRLREMAELDYKSKIASGMIGGEKQEVQQAVPIRSIVMELVQLRQGYQDFAADHTRVSSMRQMAAEFVVKLNPIIKRAISTD